MNSENRDLMLAALALLLVLVAASIIALVGMQHLTAGPESPFLRATSGDTTITLEWEHTGDTRVAKWQYQQREYEGRAVGDWSDIPKTNGERHVVENLVNGQVYAFRVRGVGSEKAVGATSKEVAATPMAVPKPVNGPPRTADCGQVLGQVQFSKMSARIDTVVANEQVERIRRKLHEGAGIGQRVIMIAGYASADGPASYNLDLSELRASAVKKLLKESFRSGHEFITASMGERHEDMVLGKKNSGNRRAVVALCAGQTRREVGPNAERGE